MENTKVEKLPEVDNDIECSWCECGSLYKETHPSFIGAYGQTVTHVDYACETHAKQHMGVN